MKLYRGLVLKVIYCLDATFNNNEYADKVIGQLFKTDKRLGSKDRKFVAETVYEIVRWKRLLSETGNIEEPYSERDLWKLVGIWLVVNSNPLPEWDEFVNINPQLYKDAYHNLLKIRKYRESIPDWMDELCVKELGEGVWEKEISALNKAADVVLRVNTLQTLRPRLQNLLLKSGIETEAPENYPDALVLKMRTNVFLTDAYKQGQFEVQDASSQLVAHFMDIKPGLRVVDTCAGAGGKSLHIAALLQNKGQLIALDIHEHKLKKLKIRARRNGVHNIECRTIESTKVIKKLHKSADRLLIDAPCSGLGVLRRNPDDKWKLSLEFIQKIKETQAQILSDYAHIVKPGGKMVYATCSILPSENQLQIKDFLNTSIGREFRFVNEKVILSSESGFDGFYMALLERGGDKN